MAVGLDSQTIGESGSEVNNDSTCAQREITIVSLTTNRSFVAVAVAVAAVSAVGMQQQSVLFAESVQHTHIRKEFGGHSDRLWHILRCARHA